MPRVWPRLAFDQAFYALLAAFFFLLPLQTRYVFRAAQLYEYGTLSVFLAEILGWVVIAMGAIKIKNEKLKMKNIWFLGLPLLAFFSIAWAPDKLVALQAAMRLLEGVLLYIVISTVAPTFQSGRSGEISTATPAKGKRFLASLGMTEWWVYAFLIGAALEAILGIHQFLTQSTFASTLLGLALHDPAVLGTSVVEFADERWLRAYGGLPHPNVLGGYLVVALGLLSYLVIRLLEEGKERSIKVLLLKITVPILITGIFFSFSRAAWAATIVLLSYWVIKVLGKPSPQSSPIKGEEAKRSPSPCVGEGGGEGQEVAHDRFYIFLIIFYVLLLTLTFRPLVATRFHGDSRLEVKSRAERVEGVREAWQLARAHPVAGVGIGNYTQALARDVRPGQPLWSYQPAHNVFLLVLAELGVVGLLLFVAALYTIVRQSKFYILHFTPANEAQNGQAPLGHFRRVPLEQALLTFLILLMFDHYLWTLPFGILLFWGFLGLSTALAQPGLDKKTAL
ncbi:O-antigen ligase family protein [Candidatus Uhrbacteria bacterium]|nr:O-antigen ligase family protein [Candidatus Uhrbacteria bacterium]